MLNNHTTKDKVSIQALEYLKDFIQKDDCRIAFEEQKKKFNLLQKWETRIMDLVVRGCSFANIAHKLGIEERTVKIQVSRIGTKFQVSKDLKPAVRKAATIRKYIDWKIRKDEEV